MTEQEMLLQEAAQEIKILRNQNQLQSMRLEIYDNMVSMFNGGPRSQSMGMGEDVVWKIEQHLKSLSPKPQS